MILFFDTETTGLPKNWKAPVTDLDNWPRLVQLAYLVYDFDGNLIHSCNEIIKPNGFTIPNEASKVHGITTEIANQRGCKIEEVFELFSIHLRRAKVVVAHNMAYDEKIIGSELIRLGLENTLDSKEKICTMESSVDLCKIDGPYGYKWPKLEELHRKLFGCDFEGAHDALADIQATAKCFWELVLKKRIKVIKDKIPTDTTDHWASKYFKPWQITLNNQEEFLKLKSDNYFFFREKNSIKKIHKQSGDINSTFSDLEILSNENIAITSTREILLNRNLITIITLGVKFEYRCLADYQYINLLKIEYVNQTDMLISYQGNGDYSSVENGILVYNFELGRAIEYRILSSEYYTHENGVTKINKDVSYALNTDNIVVNYIGWYLHGLNVISLFTRHQKTNNTKEIHIDIYPALTKTNENSKLLFHTDIDCTFEISFDPELNIILFISPNSIFIYNLMKKSLDKIDFDNHGEFKGVFCFKKPYLYLSVKKNNLTTLLVFDVITTKEIQWYRNHILPSWKIHDYFNVIIYQTENLKGFICNRFNGEILAEYETYNSLLFDFAPARRINRRKELNPKFKHAKSQYIFKMETDLFMSKDRIFLLKNRDSERELYSYPIEDLIFEESKQDEEIDDLPF